jgi:hypothetical protein
MFARTLIQALLAVTALQALPAKAEQVTRLYTSETNAEHWRITEPQVTVRSKAYPQIVARAGDKVLVAAGGCVQTGGHGATWKRYVNPDFGSAGLYHGQVQFNGVFYALTNLQDLVPLNGSFSREYPVAAGNSGVVVLGYTDDGYGDNGYWGHDDGTENQCANVGNAYVDVYIVPAPVFRRF